ncbi:hypothetical protein J8273_4316 [Carpediemonas membranifera]|uniref:Uncharacterized protein n=1 Tax=Carpediemonas membranifera TaxID=201153 RepID=A0A8J6B6P2_9EUKA|nr:hypothetical protein J8273_4316 [Carpediemonas membranifera]|eukprot:KAG9394214.1 hypothetical protein J8273_4316 [Carpediemonas membranifera]
MNVTSINPLLAKDDVQLTTYQQKWADQEFISSVDVDLVKLTKTEDTFAGKINQTIGDLELKLDKLRHQLYLAEGLAATLSNQ